MNFESFVSGSYALPQFQVDCQTTMNLIPQAVASDGGTPAKRAFLARAPGLALRQTLGDSPGRGAYAINGRAFAVAGGSFYELLTANTAVLRGTLPAGTSAVEFASNGVQVGFVADGLGFIFTLVSNAFAQIVDVNFPSYAVRLRSIDTYFITLERGTNQFSISAPLDGLSWSGLDFAASQEPDNAVSIASSHLYLWVLGSDSTVIFQDTGAASFPFQRVPGSQIEMGCAAAASVATLDNTLFWLGSSSRGGPMVYRADGFLPTRVSHHALETAMQSYSTVADATAYGYEDGGHAYYRLDFPSANADAGATWCYDVSTKLWHERGWWDLSSGSYLADPGRFHCYCFGVHLVFDYASGKVFEQSTAFASHSGNPLRWLRRSPSIEDENKLITYFAFELEMQRGSALASGQGSNPVVMLRWSNDGGATWSNYRQMSSGALGAYSMRAIARRCGQGRNRVWEVSGSDPVPLLALMGASLDLAGEA